MLLLVCLLRYVFFHNRSWHHMLLFLFAISKAHGGRKMIITFNALVEFQFWRSFSVRNVLRCDRSGDVLCDFWIKRRVTNQEQITTRPWRFCPFNQKRHNIGTIAPQSSDSRNASWTSLIVLNQQWNDFLAFELVSLRKTRWKKKINVKLPLSTWSFTYEWNLFAMGGHDLINK